MPELSHPTKVGDWSEAALKVLRERYLVQKDDGELETPGGDVLAGGAGWL